MLSPSRTQGDQEPAAPVDAVRVPAGPSTTPQWGQSKPSVTGFPSSQLSQPSRLNFFMWKVGQVALPSSPCSNLKKPFRHREMPPRRLLAASFWDEIPRRKLLELRISSAVGSSKFDWKGIGIPRQRWRPLPRLPRRHLPHRRHRHRRLLCSH